MTAQPIAAPTPTVGTDADLIRLAELYANDQIDSFSTHLTLLRLTPPQDEHMRWARFERLVHAVQRADDANEGRGDWRDLVDEDTCEEPSTVAYERACALVDDAVHALLKGDQ